MGAKISQIPIKQTEVNKARKSRFRNALKKMNLLIEENKKEFIELNEFVPLEQITQIKNITERKI